MHPMAPCIQHGSPQTELLHAFELSLLLSVDLTAAFAEIQTGQDGDQQRCNKL